MDDKEKFEELRSFWFSQRDEAQELRERIAKMQEAIDDAWYSLNVCEAGNAEKTLYGFASEKVKAEVE